MNVDTKHDLMDGARPVPITDGGQPIKELLA
jgi:hypothetical protein